MTVFVVAVGDVPYSCAALTVLGDYFKRHGVRLHVHTEPDAEGRHPSWLKMLCHRFVDDEFVLCWDLDLLPVGKDFELGAMLDRGVLNLCRDWSVALTGKRWHPLFEFNCGLIGVPRAEAPFCEAVYEAGRGSDWPSYEQYHFNEALHREDKRVFVLPQRFNAACPRAGLGTRMWESATNRHYTWGVEKAEDRAALIEEHARGYFAGFDLQECAA